MTKRKKILLGFLGLALVLVLLDTWVFYCHTPEWEPEFVSTSPDGRYSVSAYDNPGILLFLPVGLHPRGSAGTVVLRDNRTGKVLQRANARYVNAGARTPDVDWFPKSNSVGVTSVDVWDLPTE